MPTYHTVARLGEIEAGRVKHVEIGDEELGVYNLDGEYFAISDVCSHQYALLSEGEVYSGTGTVECPLHGSEFDIRTGRALSLPAVAPVPAYPVRVVGDEIQVELP